MIQRAVFVNYLLKLYKKINVKVITCQQIKVKDNETNLNNRHLRRFKHAFGFLAPPTPPSPPPPEKKSRCFWQKFRSVRECFLRKTNNLFRKRVGCRQAAV